MLVYVLYQSQYEGKRIGDIFYECPKVILVKKEYYGLKKSTK
jgi:hypothetical protein